MNQTVEIENSNLNSTWLEYNQTRLKGDKKTANKLLNRFINDLLRERSDVIEKFVYDLCLSVLDIDKTLSNNGTEVSNAKNRIQHPLFKKVLLPVLVQKYKENNALYIKWICQLEQFFYSDRKAKQQFLTDIDDRLRQAVQWDKEINTYKDFKGSILLLKTFLNSLMNLSQIKKH